MKKKIKIIIFVVMILLIGCLLFLIVNKSICNTKVDCLYDSMVVEKYNNEEGVFSFKHSKKIKGYVIFKNAEIYNDGIDMFNKLILKKGDKKLDSYIQVMDMGNGPSNEAQGLFCQTGDTGLTVEGNNKCIYTYDFKTGKFYLPNKMEIKKEDFGRYNISMIGEDKNIPMMISNFSGYEEEGKRYEIIDNKNDRIVVMLWHQFVYPAEEKDKELEVISVLMKEILATFNFN